MSIPRPRLGHGIGLRPKHFGRLLAGRPPVDWMEAVSENYLAPGGRPVAALEKVRSEVPVALHGVSLSIGSTDPLDRTYLTAVRALVDRIQLWSRRGEAWPSAGRSGARSKSGTARWERRCSRSCTRRWVRRPPKSISALSFAGSGSRCGARRSSSTIFRRLRPSAAPSPSHLTFPGDPRRGQPHAVLPDPAALATRERPPKAS